MLYKNVNKGEDLLLQWQFGQASGFVRKLFELIGHADTYNQNLLAKGFPEEVEAMQRFTGEAGYWEALRERAGV